MKFNRFVSVFLAILAVLSLSACGGSSSSSSGNNNPAPNTTAPTTTTVATTTERRFAPVDTSDETIYSIVTMGDYFMMSQKIAKDFIKQFDQEYSYANALSLLNDYDEYRDDAQALLDMIDEGVLYYDGGYLEITEELRAYIFTDDEWREAASELIDFRDQCDLVIYNMQTGTEMADNFIEGFFAGYYDAAVNN
jgi:hypothetical protein